MNVLAESEGRIGSAHTQLVSGAGHNSAALTDRCQDIFRLLIADDPVIDPAAGRIPEVKLSDRSTDEVVRQLPGAGKWVQSGTRVVVMSSLGTEPPPGQTTVPDVVGQDLPATYFVINAAGYTPVAVFVDSDRPFDEVVGRKPEGGDLVVPRTEVRLFMFKGQGDIKQ